MVTEVTMNIIVNGRNAMRAGPIVSSMFGPGRAE
jgi:hypothetical protein